jgi:hypothetical protein
MTPDLPALNVPRPEIKSGFAQGALEPEALPATGLWVELTKVNFGGGPNTGDGSQW